jgi:hypothetical protein
MVAHQMTLFQTIQSVLHGRFIQFHDGIPIRFLVAGSDQGVEGQGILIWRGDLFFEQRADDPGFLGGENDFHGTIPMELTVNPQQAAGVAFPVFSSGSPIMYQTFLFVHILAATIWTGGHLVLALTFLPESLRKRDVGPIQNFEQHFEPIGLPALGLQIATGLWLADAKQPDWGRWIGFADPISSLIFIKLILLGLTLGLAMHARLKLIPHLSPATLPALAWHITGVTLLSVAFVLVGVGLRSGGF